MSGKVMYSKRGLKKGSLLVFGVFFLIVLAGIVVMFQQPKFTGHSSFEVDIANKQNVGEGLVGDINIRLKEGELIPKESMIVVMLGEQSKTFSLSELVSFESTITGKFFAEGSQISGSGEGYGIPGIKITEPEIMFDLVVYSSGSSDEKTPSENKPVKPAVEESITSDELTGKIVPEEIPVKKSESIETEQVVKEVESVEALVVGAKSSDDKSSVSERTSVITGSAITEDEFTIRRSVFRKSPSEYNLKKGQVAKIVEGSVSIDGKFVSDNFVSLNIKDGKAVVSTQYFINEEGFGKEFLGEFGKTLNIDIGKMGFVVEPGVFDVRLVYGDAEISSHQEIVEVVDTTSNVVLIQEIPQIRIAPGGSATLDMKDYFDGAVSYSADIKNIKVKFDGSIAQFTSDKGFNGARKGVIIAKDKSGSLNSNEFMILISSGAVNIKTTREKIEVGKPVKWEKRIENLEEGSEIVVEIPASAGGIKIEKVSDVDAVDSSGLITGNVVIDVDLNKKNFFKRAKDFFGGIVKNIKLNLGISGHAVRDIPESQQDILLIGGTGDIVVSYETEGPTAIERELSDGKKGKEIVISAPDEYGYENVIASTYFDSGIPVGKENEIKLYWIVAEETKLPDTEIEKATKVGPTDIPEKQVVEEESREGVVLTGNVVGVETVTTGIIEKIPVEFDSYDSNGDGYLNYFEWVAPHLSSQIYQLVIETTKAEHLDSSRNFVSDIYPEISTLDDVWSETINQDEFVRVTFELNLTSDRDITVYTRTISGTPSIEVYEQDGGEVIAVFDSLGDNRYNKVYLNGLIDEQDVFDLLVLNGSVEFDHIIDPDVTVAPRISFSSETTPAGSVDVAPISVGLDSLEFHPDLRRHYAFLDFNNDLRGWWRGEYILNADSSSYGNDAAIRERVYAPVPGEGWYGGGFVFDGIDDSMTIPDKLGSLNFDDAGSYTWSMWVKLSEVGRDHFLISKSASVCLGNCAGYLIMVEDDNTISFGQVSNMPPDLSNNLISGTTSLTVDKFYHVAVTFNSENDIKIYINGILDASGSGLFLDDAVSDLVFGYTDTHTLHGTLDEVLIFNRVLSEEEIGTLYEASNRQYYNDFADLAEGTYGFTGYAVDGAGNLGSTDIRVAQILSSCLDKCVEGGNCLVDDCVLNNGICSDEACDFDNFDLRGALYTGYDFSGNGKDLSLVFSKSNNFGVDSSINFGGLDGVVGGNGGTLTITTSVLFNMINAHFFGEGGDSFGSEDGGNGGVLNLNYFGLIGSFNDGRPGAVAPNLDGGHGGGVGSLSGTTGSVVYGRNLDICPRDVDVNGDGRIGGSDIFLLGDAYNDRISDGELYSLEKDTNCDGLIDLRDLVLIGHQWGTR